MYYMVYYEISSGASSPNDFSNADFDDLDEARRFMQELMAKNLLKRAEYEKQGHSILDRYDEIKLCIVLDEAGY